MMKRSVKASIDILAPPETVWDVLMDFSSYPKWSSYLITIEGIAVPGSKLQIVQKSSDGNLRVCSPEVLQVTPPTVFRWLEQTLVPGLFDREHGFMLEYLFGGHTRIRQTEEIGGTFAFLLQRWFKLPSEDEFSEFNRALKKRAEARR
ncbi:MAG: SRPBCC domain-containing protein [Gammaproteobacteria bacterium]|nr:SRPBCC domain-containing protein [Gammaproteobacteria bacterium]